MKWDVSGAGALCLASHGPLIGAAELHLLGGHARQEGRAFVAVSSASSEPSVGSPPSRDERMGAP